LATRVLGDHATAEEVTLEVFVQVWKTASRYDPARGTPSAWMLTMTRTRAIDRIRAGAQEKKRRESMEIVEQRASSPDADPERLAFASERASRVSAAMGLLPFEQRQAIELAFYSGMTHSEIASTLELPLGTVKTRIRLGMDRLRLSLAGLE
jgi:RNA polymerase sigma-70 factor (ECF subfamily)